MWGGFGFFFGGCLIFFWGSGGVLLGFWGFVLRYFGLCPGSKWRSKRSIDDEPHVSIAAPFGKKVQFQSYQMRIYPNSSGTLLHLKSLGEIRIFDSLKRDFFLETGNLHPKEEYCYF